jgi:hypothetical protein
VKGQAMSANTSMTLMPSPLPILRLAYPSVESFKKRSR